MATLQSPGVQVQVIDESFYTPSAPGTVPMVFVTSAQDKTNPSGTTALGTTAANAGKVWLITSQRDLTDTFGTPLFYTDANNNPQHGDELNEYGLQAAYSLLGASSRCYVVRADLDTSQLAPTSTTPVGEPVAGTYWLDTDATLYGIKEWSTATSKFTVKTPIVLDDASTTNLFNGSVSLGIPSDGVGNKGDYCMVVTKENANKLWYKTNANTWTAVVQTFDGSKALQVGPHYDYPTFTVNGSVWVTTTTPSNGANWNVKYYNANTAAWSVVSAPIYETTALATYALDPVGGKNIPVGSIVVESNWEHNNGATASFKLWRRNNLGLTTIVSDPSTTAISYGSTTTFEIRETVVTGTTSTWGAWTTATLAVTVTGTTYGSLIPAAISNAGLTNITSYYNNTTNQLTITHNLGGEIEFKDMTNVPLTRAGFSVYNRVTSTGTVNLYLAKGDSGATHLATNWSPLVYEAKAETPYTTPADGKLWYDPVVDEVDIMINAGAGKGWVGYKHANSPYYANGTDPAGPIISATKPDAVTGQSDGTPLVVGDIWIDTSDLTMYGKNVYMWKGTVDKWVAQDCSDQSTPDGWLFADARWANTGTTTTPSTIPVLLASSYLDPDAPDPSLYPKGMKLWNTRRSGFNVKKYVQGYININANSGKNQRYPYSATHAGEDMTNYVADRWVSQYTTEEDGHGSFGANAQRAQTVNALKELIDSNAAIRDTDTLNFNLIAAPGYPEAMQNMVAFNTDRGITALVVGDTPFRLEPTGTALSNWGLNTAGALDNGADGAVSYDEYLAMYYPSGYTTDNTGNKIVVPSSHMMLRTIINSDAKSFQWFAPAGTRRGGVDNVTSVGYITSESEFKTVALHQGLRDVLDSVKINPIATLTGVGVLAYGQRTRAKNASALDRINVARLICYLRRQLDVLSRPFLFEPNDAQTRREIKAAAESLLLELTGQRALYDFIVVCDETNNTPARIDRSELYMDIAIEPVKAVEFIYIPLRIKNTGDIKAGL
jgi:hypothetical protein